ncbi:MAG: SGNH/GDSL hydrolase family protein [Pseudomonadota bacterium]
MKWLLIVALLAVSSCAPLPGAQSDARIVMLGDSVFAWWRGSGRSVGDALAENLNRPVANFSISAARISQPNPAMQFTRLQIDNQFDRRAADWIVVNGGANDLYFECLCLSCDGEIDQLVASDVTTGEIPAFLTQLRATGAQVMYVGYHRSGGLGGPYDRCTSRLDRVEDRLAQFAGQTDGIHFADMSDVFPPRDRSYYDGDLIHPSVKGSAAIGARIATLIQAHTGTPKDPIP